MPLRTFTVTGTPPAPRTAAPTRRAISRGFSGIALPPPWRVIFGAGQPKLMSTWCTPSPASRCAISRTTSGSLP